MWVGGLEGGCVCVGGRVGRFDIEVSAHTSDAPIYLSSSSVCNVYMRACVRACPHIQVKNEMRPPSYRR